MSAPGGMPGLGGCLVQGGACSQGGVWSRGVSSPRGVPREDTPGTATAAGGMHPTGMHSCFDLVSNRLNLHSQTLYKRCIL